MRLSITKHASQRRKEMRVTASDIARTIRNAEVSYPGSADNNGQVYQRGDLAVVAELLDRSVPHYRVITILPRTTEDYVRPEKETTHQ